MRWGRIGITMMPFAPVLDADSLPLDPVDAVRSGVGADVELILGSNTDEHRFFLVPPGLLDQLDDRFVDAALQIYGGPPGAPAGGVRRSLLHRGRAVRRRRERLLLPAAGHPARGGPRPRAKTWMYEFAWRSPLYAGQLGACHYLEVPFVFDTIDTPSAALVAGPAPPQELADEMHRRWLTFAATGDPGWPRLHAEAARGHDLRPRERRGRRPARRAAGRLARARLTHPDTRSDTIMSDSPFDPRASFAPGLFAGRTAVVTGGGRGIGRAIAVGFARLGANVVIASNAPEELAEAAPEIEALGVGCLPVEVNIRDVESVDAFRDACLERFGSVDYLVNNAGGQFQAHPFAISDKGWRAVIDLNLNGTWNVCSRFLRHMMERQTGSVVNIAHVFSFERGAPMFAHSGAARAGVVNLTRSLAPYAEQRNVTINALAPGTTISPEAAANYGMTVEEWRAQPSRARYADPEDMAAIVLFMCSPAARMLNGAVIVADAASTQFNWPARSTEDLFDEVQATFD